MTTTHTRESVLSKNVPDNYTGDTPKKHATIAKSRCSFSPKSRAVLSYFLSLAPPDTPAESKNSICVEASFNTLAEILSISDTSRIYIEIKNCLRELTGKVMWLVEGCTETAIPWLQNPTINREQEQVTVWISPDILQYARQYEDIYPGDYGNLPAIKSQYSTRLLLLLRGRESPVRFRVEELKAQILTQDLKSYDNNFKNFRRAVLEPAIKEINRLGNYIITMKTEYKGKKIGFVTFNIEEIHDSSQTPFPPYPPERPGESTGEKAGSSQTLFVPISAEEFDKG